MPERIAKGKGKTLVMHDVRVLVDGEIRVTRAADMLEVLLRRTREARADIRFARPVPARLRLGQLSLFAGL
jgi:hypothetical protein